MATQTQDKAHLSFQVDCDIRDRLLRRAVPADRSLSAQIRRAIAEHLERDDEKEAA
jgi:predicted transcriptional regulator